MLIDSHAHLDMSQFEKDRNEVIKRAIQNEVEMMVTIGCDIPSSKVAIRLAEQYPQVYATVGFHPHDASKMDDSAFKELHELSRQPKVVAVGEIGLDFFRNRSPKPVQLEAFKKQLAMADKLDLPVIIHDRDAHEETLSILRDWVANRRTSRSSEPVGALHCFSGDTAMANECVSLGFLVSIAGPVTYPNSSRLADVVKHLSLDDLLIETDCPYLAPQLHRGKRNEPAYVRAVAEEIARIKKVPVAEVAQATSKNAISLFRLSSASLNS